MGCDTLEERFHLSPGDFEEVAAMMAQKTDSVGPGARAHGLLHFEGQTLNTSGAAIAGAVCEQVFDVEPYAHSEARLKSLRTRARQPTDSYAGRYRGTGAVARARRITNPSGQDVFDIHAPEIGFVFEVDVRSGMPSPVRRHPDPQGLRGRGAAGCGAPR